jgi:hypothetical protein
MRKFCCVLCRTPFAIDGRQKDCPLLCRHCLFSVNVLLAVIALALVAFVASRI